MSRSLSPYWITARYSSNCSQCKAPTRKGEQIFYYPNNRTVLCSGEDCGKKASREFEANQFDEANCVW
jgi:hypothetical protein